MHDESTSRRAIVKERQRRYYQANREKLLEQRKRRYDEQHAARGQVVAECACGCGTPPTVGNRFVQGHNSALTARPQCPHCGGYSSAYRSNGCTDAFHDENRARRNEGKHRHYLANQERAAERQQQRYTADPEFRASMRLRAKAWIAANPERMRVGDKARRDVRKAIRDGILVRPDTCEQCGVTGVAIQAAHADYSRPLDVRWLCRSCHSIWDHQEPKTLPSQSHLTTPAPARVAGRRED